MAIRLNAYGITESRYYVAGFGVFALVCAVLLIAKPVKRNGMIAVLAAMLAIISVIPPLDAFTISRNSQISRLENMLAAEGVLEGGAIKAKADVPKELRIEVTSILEYLNRRDYMQYISWLPADFNPYEKMKSTFGFEAAYYWEVAEAENNRDYFYLAGDMQKPYSVSGYDIAYDGYSDRWAEGKMEYELSLGVKSYKLILERVSKLELKVRVTDAAGQELIATGLHEFAQTLPRQTSTIPADKMTLEVENNGYKLGVMFKNVNGYSGSDQEQWVDYGFIVLFGVPK